jgi:hypothetical protein
VLIRCRIQEQQNRNDGGSDAVLARPAPTPPTEMKDDVTKVGQARRGAVALRASRSHQSPLQADLQVTHTPSLSLTVQNETSESKQTNRKPKKYFFKLLIPTTLPPKWSKLVRVLELFAASHWVGVHGVSMFERDVGWPWHSPFVWWEGHRGPVIKVLGRLWNMEHHVHVGLCGVDVQCRRRRDMTLHLTGIARLASLRRLSWRC